MMRTLIVLLSACCAGAPARGEGDFEQLASEDFATREAAQRMFLDDVAKDPSHERDKILKVYLATKDPELRLRLIPVLERAYFPPRGYVGIIMEPIGTFQRGALPQQVTKGIMVKTVFPNTPAHKSGLEEGDIIVEVNDWVVEGGIDLNDRFAEKIQENPPSKEILLKVKRGEKIIEIPLKLGVLPVPSIRAREAIKIQKNEARRFPRLIPPNVDAELREFRFWLSDEIKKDTKSHR